MSEIPSDPDRACAADRERTARLLAEAMSGELAGPVDAHRLLAGARTRAHSLRRRRAVAATAAFLAVPALAIGANTWNLPGPGRTSPADAPSLGSAPAPVRSDPEATVPLPTRASVPVSTRASLTWPENSVLLVPDEAVLGGDSLGEGYRELEESDAEQDVRTTGISPCASLPGSEVLAVASRSIVIGQPDPDQSMPDEWFLHAATRVFAGSGAEEQIRWLRENISSCEPADGTMDTPLRVSKVSQDLNSTVLASRVGVSTRHPDSITVFAAVRVGRAVTGFTLFVPARVGDDAGTREEKALSTATSLLSLARTRLESSGLGPLSEQDPRLGGVSWSGTGK